jgi:hypothetical protein
MMVLRWTPWWLLLFVVALAAVALPIVLAGAKK